ncbi:hypothetical protein CEXT_615951 [Caerostris extrusa]|uniref:Uncharacterized protein n=1 Tax=Caerostris extrusa TaxID=172846 RepID=A0AAV4SHT5_CAEEX|nr:hypothetical protein CEXT_615951 [Caerostris extrusa]
MGDGGRGRFFGTQELRWKEDGDECVGVQWGGGWNRGKPEGESDHLCTWRSSGQENQGTEQQKGALTLKGHVPGAWLFGLGIVVITSSPLSRILPSVSIPSTSRYVLLIIPFFFSNTGV